MAFVERSTSVIPIFVTSYSFPELPLQMPVGLEQYMMWSITGDHGMVTGDYHDSSMIVISTTERGGEFLVHHSLVDLDFGLQRMLYGLLN
jgi:hypothetical protein